MQPRQMLSLDNEASTSPVPRTAWDPALSVQQPWVVAGLRPEAAGAKALVPYKAGHVRWGKWPGTNDQDGHFLLINKCVLHTCSIRCGHGVGQTQCKSKHRWGQVKQACRDTKGVAHPSTQMGHQGPATWAEASTGPPWVSDKSPCKAFSHL